MPRVCVYCDATDGLNTQLTVPLDDGTKITVDVCDTHSEDATVKSAREAYKKRQEQASDLQNQLAEFLAKAKALGLDINIASSGLAVASQPQTQQPQQTAAQTAVQTVQATDLADEEMVSTAKLRSAKGMVTAGGQLSSETMGGAVVAGGHASHSTRELQEQLGAALDGKAKMTVVEGRGGQPLTIPQIERDGTGTTVIQVVKTDDTTLQTRFKRLADDSRQDRAPIFSLQGYEGAHGHINCPICKGEMEIVHQGVRQKCPKCGGAGILGC